LEAYGLSGEAQKNLMNLLILSGVLSSETLEKDLRAVGAPETVIEQAKKNILEKDKNPETLIQTLFISSVFFARAGGEERWEMHDLEWMENNKAAVEAFIVSAGIDSEKKPSPDAKFDAAVVLGASYRVMQSRIAFAQDYTKQVTGNVFLLTGDRDVSATADGEANITSAKDFFRIVNVAVLIPYFSHLKSRDTIAAKFLEDQKIRLTEAGLMLFLAHNVGLQCQLVNTPKVQPELKEGSRPTTITTVIQWTKELAADQKPSHVLVVSSQPSVNAQNADVELALNKAQWQTTTCLTIGEGLMPTEQFTATYPNLNRHRRIMESFGGFVYGAFLRVARKFGIDLPTERLEIISSQHSFRTQKAELLAQQTAAANKCSK
jgi:hypothetical protein